MENASKALIIAGAILLSILIIAIGMYIYNSSQNSIYGAADQISSQEKDAFNSQWTTYDENQPGSNVKSLIGKLVTNAQTNKEEQTKLPQLAYCATAKDMEDNNWCTVTSKVGDNSTIGVTDFGKCRSAIESRHTYYVQLRYSEATGLVDGIIICYDKSQFDSDMLNPNAAPIPAQLTD